MELRHIAVSLRVPGVARLSVLYIIHIYGCIKITHYTWSREYTLQSMKMMMLMMMMPRTHVHTLVYMHRFEMILGKTPFFDKNRKLMFYRIINTAPSFPPSFSPAACDAIRGFLTVKEESRLGSEACGGATGIKNTAFFSVIDFDKLFRKELPPPFTPEVANEFDTKYVPKAFLDAEAKDSFAEPKRRGQQAQNFDAFTFVGDSALGGGGGNED